MEHFRSVASARGLWAETVQLMDDFDSYDPKVQERIREQIAVQLDGVAEEMERSAATRALFSSFTAAELRAEGTKWWAGRRP